MAKRYQKRYREYRGRRKSGSAALKVIIVLLVLVLAAGIVFVGILGGGVEYTDQGVHVVLPWREQPSQTPEQTPEPSKPVLIIEDDPTPPPTPTPEEKKVIGAVEVTAAQVLDGTAAAMADEAGGSALVVTMKGASGRLAWQSQSVLAAELGTNGKAEVNEAVAALKEERDDLWLVARVTCFRDSALVAAKVGGPLMTRGGNQWYDGKGLCWVSPCSERVTGYLAGLCQELAEMGFDEILLDCAGFPDFGETHVLATSDLRPEDLRSPVAAFLQKVRDTLEGSGAVLSVLTDEGSVAGTNELSGMTAEALAQYAGRVWVAEAEYADYATILSRAGMDLGEGSIVLLGGVQESGSWTTATHPYN